MSVINSSFSLAQANIWIDNKIICILHCDVFIFAVFENLSVIVFPIHLWLDVGLFGQSASSLQIGRLLLGAVWQFIHPY